MVQRYDFFLTPAVSIPPDGNRRAKYGEQLLINLSKDLSISLGKGFSKSNLFSMRLFYTQFPICQTVSGKLSWSHIIEIIGIDNKLERNFYLAETTNEHWSVRELRRQKDRGLFMQLALGKSKEQILALAKHGNIIEKPDDGDNPPIGIILAKEKDEVMVQYGMYGSNNNLFVSKYQLYLPDLDELRLLLSKHLS